MQRLSQTISGRLLRQTYLSEPMLHYFKRKLPGLEDGERIAQIEEALKFLYVSDNCDGSIPVTREIDEIWHLWILQTQEYKALCAALPSGKFIHHSSNDYIAYAEPGVAEQDNLLSDIKMLAAYHTNFGPFEAERIKFWHLPTLLINKKGWTINQLNEWLSASQN